MARADFLVGFLYHPNTIPRGLERFTHGLEWQPTYNLPYLTFSSHNLY